MADRKPHLVSQKSEQTGEPPNQENSLQQLETATAGEPFDDAAALDALLFAKVRDIQFEYYRQLSDLGLSRKRMLAYVASRLSRIDKEYLAGDPKKK